jgi:hypothetical protein
MTSFRSGPSSKQPYFTPSQITQICCDELRKEGLFPGAPEAIRIDRFIEKRFRVSPQYEDLPAGVLGLPGSARTALRLSSFQPRSMRRAASSPNAA